MIRIIDFKCKATLKAAAAVSVLLLFAAAATFGQQQINLTAGPATTTMPDGTVVPMWGYSCGTAVTGSTATCAPLTDPAMSKAALGSLGGIYILNGGSGYAPLTTVMISAPTGIAGVISVQAKANVVVSGGAVVGVYLTDPGQGYTAPPTFTFVGAGSGSGAVLAAGPAWSPVLITVPAGTTTTPASLQINLTNNLSFTPATGAANNIPTSIVIVGQVGGGLGGAPTTTPSPNHTNAQGCPTWFIASGATPPGVECTAQQPGASGTPPAQGPRVQSMGTEVLAAAPGTTTPTSLIWQYLKPGTYLLESGTHPSIQVPMGLIGVLVVTTAPVGTTAGTAYPAVGTSPAVSYNAEVPLEFSEIDPVQNKAVDEAVRTAGFSETAVWTRMNTGSLTSLTLTSAGSGYTTAPTVTISGGGGAGAAATATLGSGVTSVAVTGGGTGYSTPPNVSFTGGSGNGATGTATITGNVLSATVTAGGTGYTAPTVTITGGGGTGATASATIAGVITGISLTAPGSGYTAPTVTITGGGGTGATATATFAGGVITGITVTAPGSGYTSAPTVTIADTAPGTGAGATATATIAGVITGITVTAGGSGYTSAPTVTIADTAPGTGTGATATATLSATVTAIAVTSGGSYTSAPTVQLTGGGGTGAAATATVGTILTVTLTSAGGGYTTAPTVQFSGGGGGSGAAATATVATGGCGTSQTCYPPAVNYTPFYFLINGLAFDKSTPAASVFQATAGVSGTTPVTTGISGTVLVRLVNAGLRMHAPSIVGSLTNGYPGSNCLSLPCTTGSTTPQGTTQASVQGFTLIAEDGNVLPNVAVAGMTVPAAPRVQTDVLMVPGKVYDVEITAPTTTTTTGTTTTVLTIPIFARDLALSANASDRDAGMLAYISVNNTNAAAALPTTGVFGAVAVKANSDTYNSVPLCLSTATSCTPFAVSDPSKGVIGNDINVYTVELMSAPSNGTLTCNALPGSPVAGICANGTFTYTPNIGAFAAATSTDSFQYCANGANLTSLNATNLCTTVTLNGSNLSGTLTAIAQSYTSKMATFIKIPSPGILLGNTDPNSLPLSVVLGGVVSASVTSGGTGYAVGDTISLNPATGGSGSGAVATVATINTTTGAILTVTISAPGSGYTTAPTVDTTLSSAKGTGAVLAATLATGGVTLPPCTVPVTALCGTADAAGGFTASVPSSGTYSFTYNVQNSQGKQSTNSATVTLVFPPPSNLTVKVLDAQLYAACNGSTTCISGITPISDYRWIVEEDRTFWVDPNCTTNSSITTPGCPAVVGASSGAPAGTSTVPTFGVNFHASTMPYVAQGCTGPLSCEYGQTMICGVAGAPACPTGTAPGSHINAVCDVGVGACRADTGNGTTSGGFTWVNPSQVVLDPSKRYYISVLPGDAANPFPANLNPPNCSPTGGGSTTSACGHTMSGAPIPPVCNILGGTNPCSSSLTFANQPPVNVLVLPTPLPTGKLSVIVFEDDFPLNGEQDGGGGNGTIAPIEPGLGGFNLVLWDTFGGLGDITGQNTYDMFNQPLSNSLAGLIDPNTNLDACPISLSPLSMSPTPATPTAPQGPTGGGAPGTTAPNSGMTGMIVTCPKFEADGTTLSPLAGQAVIANLMPEKFSVQAYPGADRIARGEQWVQTNTLDGQHAHDSFVRIGEPSYFQEYGPAGYHVSIGFANPAIINARAKDVCAGAGTPGTVGACSNTITGQVDVERISRTPDQRLYPSGSRDGLIWTQCWVSLGDPDAEDFMFTFCDAAGNFKFTNVPGGEWRLTIGDQWNDQIIDGLSTPVNVGTSGTGTVEPVCPGAGSTASACNLGNIGVQQWQSNLYTRTFLDVNKTGIWDPVHDVGIPLIYTMIHYRDGHTANNLVTDFNGVANFNETYPLFNWYVVEADSGRYKTTGIHTVYDAGGPADGSTSCGDGTTARKCGTSTGYSYLTNTFEGVPLPADLSVPGAVYCSVADCTTAEATGFAGGTAKPSSATASTGRIDPPWVWAEGWAGLTGLSNWIDFGKAPYAACNPALPASAANNYCATVTTTAPGSTTPTTRLVGENGGIHGLVVYASTRPFDSAEQMIQQPWEPNVPNVVVNLYKEGFAADGVTPTLSWVDTTTSSSWDDWAQGFYPNYTDSASGTSMPYMNCPGQGTNVAGSPNQDLFYFTLFDQPNYLDYYNGLHSTPRTAPQALPYNSQYKCYDSMHIANQIQPAPYDGRYFFPSSLGVQPSGANAGKPVTTLGCVGVTPYTPCPATPAPGITPSSMPGTNCTICVPNPDSTDHYRYLTPMLPPGKYVVQVMMPPGYEVYKEEDKNLLIGDNFIAPVTQQFGGLGTYIFIIPDQASVASMYDPNGNGYNPNNFQNQTTQLDLQGGNLSGVPGFPGFQDPLWPCVGEMRVVPDYLSLFPQAKEVAPFAGATRPMCDRKEVTVVDQMSVSAKFFIYTSTHIAAKYTGGITDDYTSEFDPFSPQFGEKFAPPNMPVTTKDYLGNELSRVYADHWGTYDGLAFSSWEVNPPNITGYSPTMQVQCMNDPGPILDTRANVLNASGATVPNPTYGQMIIDPLYNPAYSNFCYTDPYMPGLTQYLDTPVVPTQAFVGAAYNIPDCSYPDATPAIKEVDGDAIGPWVSAAGGTLTITALGDQLVNNSAYSGPSAHVAPFNLKTITRHYGFGTQCTTPTVGSTTCRTTSEVAIGGVPAGITSWSDTQIIAKVPMGVPNCVIQQQTQYTGSAAQCGQLVITAGNGKQSIDSVTVTIGGKPPTHVSAGQSIQSAIDAAMPGDLIIIDPTCVTTGTTTAATCSSAFLHAATPTQNASAGSHNEMLIMWKPVRLQGVGAATSIINASAFPAGKLLDPWRRHINCLFGLDLQGVPYTAATGTHPYDSPTDTANGGGPYTCPDSDLLPGMPTPTPWAFFTAQPNSPQIDRLPLEATVGWDATQNGNLAEQLQEPSLMGAYEGAGITVLGKGLEFHGAVPWTDTNEGGAFPTGTTLLSGVVSNPGGAPGTAGALLVGDANLYCHTVNYNVTPFTISSDTNPYPSNFSCNPSSIDGLSVTSSSQGGGGIFLHGWAHYIQVANNRIFNNAGTLTGGISVGQGEFPTPYVQGGTTNAAPGSCSDGTGLITNQHQPYCLQLQVNVHNNYITNNSSLGDELFAGTLSGGGGVTLCTGNDYYQFNYNFVCGNLSSGEGGGIVHMGEIQDGDIEHNTIVFNQSQNPTIPTNGGGIQIMGTPDTDPVCGAQIDTDCPPGLSDGIGHNLVINANLIQGNMAESGSGGGIRLQQVNGTDVSTFPGNNPISAADEGHTVTIFVPATAALPAVGNAVTIVGVTSTGCAATATCGFDGTGFIVTGIASDAAGGGPRFTYLATATGLGTGTGGTFTNTSVAGQPAQTINTATETGAGVVTITSTLNPAIGDSVTVTGVTCLPAPCGYNGTYTVTGLPAAGMFTYNDPTTALAAGTNGTVFDSNPNQAVGVLWNSVSITNNIIVNNLAGWDGAGISLQDSLNVSIINNTIVSNDSLASSGVLTQSVGTPQASAPAGNCVQGNLVSSCPQIAGLTSTPNSSVMRTTLNGLTLICPFGEAAGGTAGTPPTRTSCAGFSNPLLQNNVIWQNRSFYIGIGNLGQGTQNQQKLVSLFDAFSGTAAPVQTASGQCSTGVSYWDIGVRGDPTPGPNTATGFALNPTYSVLDDPGYAASNLTSNPNIAGQYCNGSRVPPNCTVADGCGGPSGYGVPPGIADAQSPNPVFSLTPAATVDEGNNWINVSFGPLALSDDSLTGGANANYGGGNPFGNYVLVPASPAIDYVPVAQTHPTMDFFGNPRPDPSNLTRFDVGAVEFQGTNVTTPVLNTITPNAGQQGTVVNVTLGGQSLTGATAVNVFGGGGGGGGGITVAPGPYTTCTTVITTNCVSADGTTLYVTFTISATASVTARNVTVSTPAGTTNAVTFTVMAAGAPMLTNISPNFESRGMSQSVTLTGTNFMPGATVHVVTAGGGGAGGLTITTVSVSSTSITATFSTLCGTTGLPSCSSITLGVRQIDVVSGGQASNSLPFTVNGPMLTAITPNSATKAVSGSTIVNVTFTGIGLTGILPCTTTIPPACPGVSVSGGNVTVTNVTPSTTTPDTTVTATLTFTSGATTTARNVTVTTTEGASNPVTFTLVAPGQAPVLTAITPNSATQAASGTTIVPVTLTGTGLTGISAVNVSGSGVTVSGVTPSTTTPDTTVTATLTFLAGASTTPRSVTATTPNGTSNPVTFTLIATSSSAPVISSITPNSVAKNVTGTTIVNVTITGTGFTGILTCTTIPPACPGVNVTGGGVTVSGVTPSTTTPDTTVTATLAFSAGASTTPRSVTVITAAGTSNVVTFTLLSAPGVLTSIAPNTGVPGTSVTVTFTGCGIAGSTAVSFVGGGGGGGVTLGTPTTTHTGTGCPSDPDTVSATFTISAGAPLTARNVRLASPTGNTNTQPFTVVSPGTPTITSITPNAGLRGTSVPVVITGTGFTTTGTTAHVATPANGVSITPGTVVNSAATCGAGVPLPCLTATVTISASSSTALGARQIYVITPGGTTGDVTFSVNGPALTSITPASAERGTTVAVSIFGSGLTNTTAINIPGGGISGGPGIPQPIACPSAACTVVSDTQVNVTFVITAGAAGTARNVTVTAPGGPTNAVTFTVVVPPPPTLTSIAPNAALRGTASTPNVVPVTLIGTNFFGTPTVTVAPASGVTVSGVTVMSPEQVTATFTITNAAALSTRNVTITVDGVASNALPFTVQGSTLTSISPTSGAIGSTGTAAVPVTLTGTNLSGATAVAMSGTGVTCTGITSTATTVNATCAIATTAALTARNVTVTTPISTATLTGAFQVTGATLSISAPLRALLATGSTGTITVSNTSSGTTAAPFTLTANPTITPAGTATAGFTITGGTCVSGFAVAPQSNCTINVQFAAASATIATAHVTVTGTGINPASQNSATFSTTEATLTISAPAPALTTTPATTATKTGTITVTNTSTGASAGVFTFTAAPAITPAGTATAGFTITGGTCASGVAVNPGGGNCTIIVQYAPGTSTTTATANVTVTGTGLATASLNSASFNAN